MLEGSNKQGKKREKEKFSVDLLMGGIVVQG